MPWFAGPSERGLARSLGLLRRAWTGGKFGLSDVRLPVITANGVSGASLVVQTRPVCRCTGQNCKHDGPWLNAPGSAMNKMSKHLL